MVYTQIRSHSSTPLLYPILMPDDPEGVHLGRGGLSRDVDVALRAYETGTLPVSDPDISCFPVDDRTQSSRFKILNVFSELVERTSLVFSTARIGATKSRRFYLRNLYSCLPAPTAWQTKSKSTTIFYILPHPPNSWEKQGCYNLISRPFRPPLGFKVKT